MQNSLGIFLEDEQKDTSPNTEQTNAEDQAMKEEFAKSCHTAIKITQVLYVYINTRNLKT